jgi:hypothetical protein
VANLDNDILESWKKLTTEEKRMVLERIRLKAAGVKLEPIQLEDLHPRTRVIKTDTTEP